MNNIADIQASLKGKGYRKSPVREKVLAHFFEAKGPISAKEIISNLNSFGLTPNKTTIYREIEKLMKEGLILEIDLLDGQKRYELTEEDNHHHHAVCTNCGKVECVEMDSPLEEIEKSLQKSKGFAVKHHILEFFGLCEACLVK